VDGNVLRVFSRINGDFSDIMQKQTRDACRDVLRDCMPEGRTSEYTQALMELGATVCLPNGEPLCGSCPARDFCLALRDGLIADLPVKAPPKPRKIEERTVYFILYGDCVALRRRPEGGLLSGLWEFPNGLRCGEPKDLPCEGETFGDAKHIFSHIEWRMTSRVCRVGSPDLPPGYVWANVAELETEYAVPAAFRAFLPALSDALSRS
jgi:A/G-specific adenine glycosylase